MGLEIRVEAPHPAFSLVKEFWLQPAGVGRQQEVSNHYVVSVVEGKGKNKRAQVGKSQQCGQTSLTIKKPIQYES